MFLFETILHIVHDAINLMVSGVGYAFRPKIYLAVVIHRGGKKEQKLYFVCKFSLRFLVFRVGVLGYGKERRNRIRIIWNCRVFAGD